MQLFERPRQGERAVLVHVTDAAHAANETLQEFTELATSAGAELVAQVSVRIRALDPATLIAKGKREELASVVQTSQAELVLVSRTLTPAQERNLERELKCRVLDRTGLILDIFAQRARSFEGKLQVELAQLRHISTRLVRGWTHLERQRGGIGLRGPGETQLETDRRLIGERIKQLRKRLDKVLRQRHEQRKSRVRSSLMTVSVVGYTNAGKSTLFNQLTGAEVYAADRLFATLDPTLRRLELPGAPPVILADTVGFVRDLPHSLVAAFRATLEETVEADLLLHVADAHDEAHLERIEQVNAVLAEIEAEAIPQLLVFNKIDQLPERTPRLDRDADGKPQRVWLSAHTGEGLDLLREALAEYSRSQSVATGWELDPVAARRCANPSQITLPPEAGRLRAVLYARQLVRGESVGEDGAWILDLAPLPPDVALRIAAEVDGLNPNEAE